MRDNPVQLNYQIICDAAWQTLSANVEGWLGNTVVGIQIKTDPSQRWWLNEVEQPDVMGCIDLDLNFSPSTNLLPIRRLDVAIGETADIKAAWLRFPSFKLEPLPQRYQPPGRNDLPLRKRRRSVCCRSKSESLRFCNRLSRSLAI